MSPEKLRDRIRDLSQVHWHHTLRLLPDVVVNGAKSTDTLAAGRAASLGVVDLANRSVVDVGTLGRLLCVRGQPEDRDGQLRLALRAVPWPRNVRTGARVPRHRRGSQANRSDRVPGRTLANVPKHSDCCWFHPVSRELLPFGRNELPHLCQNVLRAIQRRPLKSGEIVAKVLRDKGLDLLDRARWRTPRSIARGIACCI